MGLRAAEVVISQLVIIVTNHLLYVVSQIFDFHLCNMTLLPKNKQANATNCFIFNVDSKEWVWSLGFIREIVP